MPKLNYYFRPECGREDRVGPVYGPFQEALQLTYTTLRETTKGEDLAYFGKDEDWHIVGPDQHQQWSDIVIWAETEEVLCLTS